MPSTMMKKKGPLQTKGASLTRHHSHLANAYLQGIRAGKSPNSKDWREHFNQKKKKTGENLTAKTKE